MKHIIYRQLLEKNIIDANSLELFHEGTRDNPDIKAFKCNKTGLILLDKIETQGSYYPDNLEYTTDHLNLNTSESTRYTINDDWRRKIKYNDLFQGKSILDFGCGQGNFARYLHGLDVETVEVNNFNRKNLNESGVKCFKDLTESTRKYDIIILNHVFEHLIDLNYFLELFYNYLKPKGQLIIEVPSANDFLIKTLNLSSFISFTLWSQHLILWTPNTLNEFVEKSKFKVIHSEGFQRYPFSNHFGWINDGKPGGHQKYTNLNIDKLDFEYKKMLSALNQTDTIISVFEKI